MKFLKFFSYLYFLILPLCYFAYIIYLRLFLDRGIRILFIPLSNWQIFFTIVILIGLFLRIFYILRRLKIIKIKETENKATKLIMLFVLRFSEHIENIKKHFYIFLLPKSIEFHFFVLRCITFLYKHAKTRKFTLFILIFEIFSKIIVLICFLVDIFFFQQFYYFYKSIGLLLLPLIVSIFEFILIKYFIDNLIAMLVLISSKPCTVPGLEEFDEFCFIDKDEIPDFILNIDDFIDNHFIPIFTLYYYLGNITGIRISYKFDAINLIITLGYVIGWCTILIFGILI